MVLALFAGCAAKKTTDYSAFKQSRPRSIVVLPPVNESPDVKATYSVLSQISFPLAEAGYYVMPVALVDETFRQNGLTTPNDIAQVPAAKLHEIFGADAALYISVSQYGTKYIVIGSQTVVTVSAKLVDLKSGAALWTGTASAASDEGNNNSGGGLVGILITAAVKQIINTATDASHPVAGLASNRLLSAGHNAGLLYGPRSPKYGTD
ncbi:DUF799 domain-containing protein [Pseudomonas sp. NA-150]|uniref:DUF799 domain-containing protein n=1 Tax=Pseudomonas sp. NA-150 TaxID=3367525 RepID=UPI0037CA15D4